MRRVQEDSDKSSFAPSPASGIKVSDYGALSDGEKDEVVINDNVVSSVTWLLERERGNVDFRKYSGTLEHPRHTDKQGATINAFQHFMYLNSNKSLLLADIQCGFICYPYNRMIWTTSQLPRATIHPPKHQSCLIWCHIPCLGRSHLILVVHPISFFRSDSGAGDHGEDGIQTFVDQHECGQRCKQLGLERLVQPEVDDD